MMFKKIIISCVLMGMLFVGLSKADVQSVKIRYCEDSDNPKANTNKVYSVQPGKEKELCIYFYSSSPTPVEVSYGFANGVLNSEGGRSCSSDMTSKNEFGKFFVGSGQRKFTLTSDAPYMVKENFLTPMGMSGEVNGCLVYAVSGGDKKANEIFDIVVRKTSFLDFFVGSKESISNKVKLMKNPGGVFSTNSDIKATINEGNKLVLSFLVKNEGNVSQSVSVTGDIYNILGFEKTYESESINIGPGESKEIIANIGVLPVYKGFFTVGSNLKNDPVFSFDTSSMDPALKKGSVQSNSATIYVFSWITLIILVVLILIIIKIVLPRKVLVIKK